MFHIQMKYSLKKKIQILSSETGAGLGSGVDSLSNSLLAQRMNQMVSSRPSIIHITTRILIGQFKHNSSVRSNGQ